MTARNGLAGAHARQVADWPLARKNYEALAGVETCVAPVGGFPWRVQFNPARALSASANIERKAIESRPCFLCAANRPAEQRVLAEERGYEVLVNPYPVFPLHFTIASKKHEPQSLEGRVADMVAFAEMMPGMAVFYNGPRCGASAPDHMHFQAVPARMLPLFGDREGFPLKHFRFPASEAPAAVGRMLAESAEEPMMNVYAHKSAEGEETEVVIIPRRAHRPSLYGTGKGQMLVSPAAVECAGVMITPRREDFERMDSALLEEILKEVCYAEL